MDPLPEEVKRFLEAHIDSVDQLEILRVLGENPEREWPAAALAREVQTQPQILAGHLTALHNRGLIQLTSAPGSEPCCRHGQASADLEKQVHDLLQLYRQRPVTMINLVYARAAEALKSFADAFRLRKES